MSSTSVNIPSKADLYKALGIPEPMPTRPIRTLRGWWMVETITPTGLNDQLQLQVVGVDGARCIHLTSQYNVPEFHIGDIFSGGLCRDGEKLVYCKIVPPAELAAELAAAFAQ